MTKIIDLRSDANTLPTKNMRVAMSEAVLGDDILGEDPTVNKLQQLACEMLGMESALLTASGTMSNAIAISTLTEQGDEVIVGRESHLYNLELSGMASLSQVQPRAISMDNDCFNINELKKSIQVEGHIQKPKTGLICLENTYNLNVGNVLTLENMAEIRKIANQYELPVYLDGARLFNASSYLNVPPSDICKYVDAVQFCLTKGLGCPVGSLLLGTKSFIQKSKRVRQRLGGGIRQAGVIAAPGILGLTDMVKRISEDHFHAQKLAKELSDIPGIELSVKEFQTNIVSFKVTKQGWDASYLKRELENENILVKKIEDFKIRLVTHYQISEEDISHVIKNIKKKLQVL